MELIRRLRAFVDGHETHDSLQSWARSLWGDTEDGPMEMNSVGTSILENAWNAAVKLPSRGEADSYILRTADAIEYIRLLQRGIVKAPLTEVAGLLIPLRHIGERLGLETERHIISGLGWFEFLQIASLGTGRTFVLSRSLGRDDSKQPMTEAAVSEKKNDAQGILEDLFETLEIDFDDVGWLAQEFRQVSLPRWILQYQEGDNSLVPIATFSGFRKAEATLRQSGSRYRLVYDPSEPTVTYRDASS